jgi:nicotinamide riboside kinase
MHKIGLIGGPGSGKTTLALGFVSHMKQQGRAWVHVSEYARDFIEAHGKDAPARCGDFVQFHFLEEQARREQRVHPDYEGFVTDSPLFLAWVYAAKYTSREFSGLIAKRACYERAIESLASYTAICWVRREKAYVQDAARLQTEAEVRELDDQIVALVRLHGFEVHEISGSAAERVSALEALCKGNI